MSELLFAVQELLKYAPQENDSAESCAWERVRVAAEVRFERRGELEGTIEALRVWAADKNPESEYSGPNYSDGYVDAQKDVLSILDERVKK
jgi:hypothetical protein